METPFGVYILLCKNGKFYTGFTTNIDKRLIAHRKGQVAFTRNKLPLQLIHLSLFKNKRKAYDFERYLKTGSGVAFRNRHLI